MRCLPTSEYTSRQIDRQNTATLMDYELPVILPLTTERESSVAAGGTMKEENDFEEEEEGRYSGLD